MVGDFIVQETDQLRMRLQQTEDDLRKARNKAGVISIEDTKKILTEQMSALQQQIFNSDADLAQRTALLKELTKNTPSAPSPAAPKKAEPDIPREKQDEYRATITRIANYQRTEEQLLTQFTAENGRVKDIRALLADADATKRKLEEAYPKLGRTTAEPLPQGPIVPTIGRQPPLDAVTAAAEIVALQAKIKQLNTQLDSVRQDAARIDAADGEISQLRRKKDLDEANYKLFASSLEASRISETLGNGRVSNISQIQTPSPPAPDFKKLQKILAGIAGGGIVLGLTWAFLIEFYLDRSVRRPVDVERSLRLPLLLSIPILPAKRLKAQLPKDGANGTEVAVSTASEPLHVFHETLRDRIVSFLESRGLTHKPKLIAVTGLGLGAGVTTTAAGLARSLSETGDGNVLLVDMTAGGGSSQQFIKGKPACDLDQLLDGRDNAHVKENLYVVAETSNSDRLSRNLPQRFTKLVPKLKASDFDYIIFDMPTVSQISITPRMAGFMDMVLMVVESEKTDRDVTQRAAELLAESKAHVGVVLNKTRSYIPARLHREFLAIS
jgi:Mrp family chromosome partitioning ATPase/capsule polysaccharide export protein KpsE/RkpR